MSIDSKNPTEDISKSRPTLKTNTVKQYVVNLKKLQKIYDTDDYDFLKKVHEDTLVVKEKQISDLNLLLKEEMSKEDHTEWWILGGVAIGIVLSLGVFYASVEIAK